MDLKMDKKGQLSLEYILLSMMAILIISLLSVPILLTAIDYSSDIIDSINSWVKRVRKHKAYIREIEESTPTYEPEMVDIKLAEELKNSLDKYNAKLQSVSEFINKDVAENIVENTKTIQEIKSGNTNVVTHLMEEKSSIEELSENYRATNALLKKILEKNDVNEEYIFEILDRWAEDRKLKIKKYF